MIVHQRGTNDNFIVIEAKKSSTIVNSNDLSKLRRFKSELGYRVAVAITFQVSAAAREANAMSDVYEVFNESD